MTQIGLSQLQITKLYFQRESQLEINILCKWICPSSSAAQKIKKLSETPVTVHNIAKLCVIDGKNREITKKLVQPVTPPDLEFVATVATGGRVKFLSAV